MEYVLPGTPAARLPEREAQKTVGDQKLQKSKSVTPIFKRPGEPLAFQSKSN